MLRKKNFAISDESLRTGLKTVIHKGRLEKINNKPLMIFDGAHNKPAIENLIESINMYYNNRNKVYVVSILKTKDYKIILELLLKDINSTFIFTSGNDEKIYISKDELYNEAMKYENTNLYANDLDNAIDFVEEKFKNSVIFFVGSFYVYRNVIQKIRND